VLNCIVSHDPLCLEPTESFCLNCAHLSIVREDERYRVVEQLMVMPKGAPLDTIMGAIIPVKGDQLRRNEPRGDIQNFKDTDTG
jgi:hypothetical protein